MEYRSNHKSVGNRHPRERSSGRFTPAATSFVLTCAALLLLFITVAGNHGLLYLQKINNELHSMRAKNRSLESEILKTQREIEILQKSDLELERRAREELGLSKPGETVYFFSRAKRPSARS